MNPREAAQYMRAAADVMDQLDGRIDTVAKKPAVPPAEAAAAAVMLCYIRDLVTAANNPLGTAEVLVMLEMISRDSDIFPCGVGVAMWDSQEEAE